MRAYVRMAFLVFAIGLASTAWAVTCETNLVNHRYACDVRDQNGGLHTDCFGFENSSISDFKVQNSFLVSDYSCSCRATGTFATPHFDKSASDFTCVYRDLQGQGFREAIVGHVVNPNLTMEIVTIQGFSYLLKCKKVPAC